MDVLNVVWTWSKDAEQTEKFISIQEFPYRRNQFF